MERQSSSHDRDRNLLGDEKDAGEKIRFVLRVSVPVAAANCVESGFRFMEEQRMRELV